MTPKLLLLLIVGFSATVIESVFGDGNPDNGIEDQRVQRFDSDSDSWPVLFNAVGKVVCNGKTEGSGVLLDFEGQPVVLTAGHVLDSFDLGDCEYQSSANHWNRGELVKTLGAGNFAEADQPLPLQYQNDWSMATITPWTNWQHWAVSKEQIVASQQTSGTAFLVGFDVVSGQLKAHIRCNFGSAEQSILLEGTSRLVWDDCHSTGGASGGALFIKTPEGIQLLGIRIGSLFFEKPEASLPPEMGDRFDLQRHINVSLLVADIVNQ